MSPEKLSIDFWLSRLDQYLRQERYSPQAVQRSMVIAKDFLIYLKKRNIEVQAVTPTTVTLYLQNALRLYQRRHGRSPKSLHAPRSSQWWRYSHTTSINMLLRLVRGHWPPSPLPAADRDICAGYDKWMDDLRGLSAKTRSGRCAEARRFLSWLEERDSRQNLLDVTVRDVDTYTMHRTKSLRRTTAKRWAADLRSFLHYLYSSGRVSLDLGAAVITPRLYAFENIPAALRPEEIKAVLEATRKDRSPKGLRDYAMLMLLSSYGLRAGEVTALQLDHVDWRNDTIRIHHSKTGAYSELPLLPAVGSAIFDYLRNARPKTGVRELFIRTCAPYCSFRNGSSLHRLVHIRLVAAGVAAQGRRGPHAFRHARAVSMLRAAVPLKQIGDILGHRSPDSAAAYLKLATEDLRAVALEIPAEVRA